MRKTLLTLVLLSILAAVITPMVASGQLGPVSSCNIRHDLTEFYTDCDPDNNPIDEGVTQAWGLCCFLDAISTVTDWIFAILMVAVALFVSLGGFTIVTAGGDPSKVTSGRNYILYAMLGMAVALLARAFPSIINALLVT